jgi:hypothetical protein
LSERKPENVARFRIALIGGVLHYEQSSITTQNLRIPNVAAALGGLPLVVVSLLSSG